MGPSELREALVVMAKAPHVGSVKTRLYGALGAERATALYACFVRDTFALVASVLAIRPKLSGVLCYAPDGAARAFDGLVPPDVVAVAQRGGSLGDRLESCFRDVFARGAGSVVVIGADSPTLPPEYVLEAFEALDRGADVALGPTLDGGYYLVGLRSLHETLFERIPWSTNRVFAETIAGARRADLEVHVLGEWFDVDEPADVERLRLDLSRRDGCDSTRAFFEP